MNRTLLVALSFLCLQVGSTFGELGCMDNSWHLTQNYDNKSYHYVACHCPCKRNKQLHDGTCSRCLHRHQPQKQITLSHADVTQATQSSAKSRTAATTSLAKKMQKVFGQPMSELLR